MSKELSVLADPRNRAALLLAETAAWLHDDFKHTDGHINKYVTGAPSPSGRQDAEDLIPPTQLSLLGNLLRFSAVKKRRKDDFVQGYLNRCHYAAHIEKRDGDGKQTYPAYISSPFGYERDQIPPGLTSDLRNRIPWSEINKTPFAENERNTLQERIAFLFSRVGGDTRRPANEITLWEWGHTVGALYKAALCGALLGFQPIANDLRWRLLSIRFDGLAFFAQGHHLPDLLARRKLLGDALDSVRELLEVTYPLGTEVYRDENGSVFVVPGCEKGNCTLDLLALDGDGKTLQEHILDRVSAVLEGEVVPKMKLDADPWWGQDPQRQGNDEPPPIADHLKPVTIALDPHWVSEQWNTGGEICTVCGLRPQGLSQKAKDRHVCGVCERRRADRSKDWAAHLDTTIWTDEVADINGRLALIVGQFDLDKWLDGTMVQTLSVTDPASGNMVAKNPSFARLRRVWETTKCFWVETRAAFPTEIGEVGPRLEIAPQNRKRLDLGHFHTYELVLGRVRLSVVWDSDNHCFITCDNLDYLAKPEQLSRPVKQVLIQGATFTVEEPVGYGGKNKTWGKITLAQNAKELPGAYAPAIPILAEPRTFMALVPAGRALDVVRAIKTKYEREMGKVRNRLSLHLGLVYAHRRTPLRAILDAGRRMLEVPPQADQPWTVAAVSDLPQDAAPSHLNDPHFAQWCQVHLKRNGRTVLWRVPLTMGDGMTEDAWYPYVFLETNGDDGKVSGRNRAFKGLRPTADGVQECWLVHASELKQGEEIYFTPATLDWVWLDTTGRRFEIAYDEQGRRRDLPRRPYLLDELETIEQIWKTLSHHLSPTQIHALRDLVEAKWEAWEPGLEERQKDGMFWQFCHDAIANAEWRREPWRDDRAGWLDTWASYAACGWLADTVELCLQIMKEEVAS